MKILSNETWVFFRTFLSWYFSWWAGRVSSLTIKLRTFYSLHHANSRQYLPSLSLSYLLLPREEWMSALSTSSTQETNGVDVVVGIREDVCESHTGLENHVFSIFIGERPNRSNSIVSSWANTCLETNPYHSLVLQTLWLCALSPKTKNAPLPSSWITQIQYTFLSLRCPYTPMPAMSENSVRKIFKALEMGNAEFSSQVYTAIHMAICGSDLSCGRFPLSGIVISWP